MAEPVVIRRGVQERGLTSDLFSADAVTAGWPEIIQFLTQEFLSHTPAPSACV